MKSKLLSALLIFAYSAAVQTQDYIKFGACNQKHDIMIVEGREVICDGKSWVYFPNLNTPTSNPTTTPIPTATPTPRWAIVNWGADILPLVEGPKQFVYAIRDGLNWLYENSIIAFDMVVENIDVIAPGSHDSTSIAYVESGRVEIGRFHTFNEVILATVMFHEACHMYQYEQDPMSWTWASDWQMIEFEKECTEGEIVFLEHIEEHLNSGESLLVSRWLDDARKRLLWPNEKWIEYFYDAEN